MKKTILTLLGLLMIISASADAQTTFLPVLTEGKSWQVATYNDDPNNIIKVYSVSVGGDTIVNNLTCKKIDVVPKDSHMTTASPVAYEENGKVWKVEENGQMVLIFDVGLHLNEQFSGVAHVVGEDTICVNGVSRKRLKIDSGCDCINYMYYVVEGIGISLDECVMYLGVGNGSHPCRMVSCSENGETIFTYEDFMAPATAIATVEGDRQVSHVRYYNLAGVEGAELLNGVNIKVTTYTDGSRSIEKVLK
jgi:hypothetical protein